MTVSTSDFPSFPKIFHVGDAKIPDLFADHVEITEKIDGSQFSFGMVNGEFMMRSKGQLIYHESAPKMFQKAVDFVMSKKTIIETLHPERVFYCEYLEKPKHNMLAYTRVPKNHLILFGVRSGGKFLTGHWDLQDHASFLDIDAVTLLSGGIVTASKELWDELLQRESCLGGHKIEGFVVKNYARDLLIGGMYLPLTMGKYVSEAFKEVHSALWKKEHGRGQVDGFIESFRSEARWRKALQRLTEDGVLEHSPRDIGKVMRHIHQDIKDEEEANIKAWLYQYYIGWIVKKSTSWFPEFYKGTLLERAEREQLDHLRDTHDDDLRRECGLPPEVPHED